MAADEPMDSEIVVEVLYSGTQCGSLQADFQAEWLVHPDQLGGVSGSTGTSMALNQIKWDPETEAVLWIRMGVQPTGGYGLLLDDPVAPVQGGVASVSLQWRKPAPDMFVTQVLTSPCLVLKLPRAGIGMIHIRDQQGVLRARVEDPEKNSLF